MNIDDAPYMSLANVLGHGFDIYGTYNEESLIQPLFDFDLATPHIFRFLDKDYRLPSVVIGYEQTASNYNEGTFKTREETQNKIAVHAKVEASYGAFSGQMEASYSNQVVRSSEYFYAFKNFYTRLGYLELKPNFDFLRVEFKNAIESLPAVVTRDNFQTFADFFSQFGVYYTARISLGASFEFYISVSKSSLESTEDVSAMVSAQYTGIVFTGSIESDVKNSETWKKYNQNSRVSLKTIGGNPTQAGRLAAIDAKNPSQGSVDAYNGWLETVGTDPAVVDFKLAGIWELCGTKRSAVQQAWTQYGQIMRPRLTMETSSFAKQPPLITLGRAIKPFEPPQHLFGYQVIIIDRRNLLSDTGVKFNRYYSIPREEYFRYFRNMYNEMAKDILSSGYDNENYFLIVASMGLVFGCVPTENFYTLLRAAGAGKRLREWTNINDAGSGFYPDVNYLFIGTFNQGADVGVELLEVNLGPNRIVSELDIFFYRQSYGGIYTFGLGGSSSRLLDEEGNVVNADELEVN